MFTLIYHYSRDKLKMNSKDYEDVCNLLDKLYLDALCLMEEEIKIKINMEKSMVEGENNLAKCRYIMGSNSVSAMNIPLNPEEEIPSVLSVQSSPIESFPKVTGYELVSVEDTKEVVDPIRWFGFFTPQNLLKSQKCYKTSLLWAIQAINMQNQLKYLCDKYKVMKLIKASLAKAQ